MRQVQLCGFFFYQAIFLLSTLVSVLILTLILIFPAQPKSLEQLIDEQMGAIPPHRMHKRSGLKDTDIKYPIETTNLPDGYIIYRKRLSWKDAHQVCEEKVGHLAGPVNAADAKKLIDEIFKISEFSDDYDWGKTTAEFGLDRRYWIGLNDINDEGVWSWAGKSKKLNYEMWYPNQPDHVNKDGSPKSGRLQHCGSLWNRAYWKLVNGQKSQTHTFDDLECDWKLYFICEKDDVKMEKLKKARESHPTEPPRPSQGPKPPSKTTPAGPGPNTPPDTTPDPNLPPAPQDTTPDPNLPPGPPPPTTQPSGQMSTTTEDSTTPAVRKGYGMPQESRSRSDGEEVTVPNPGILPIKPNPGKPSTKPSPGILPIKPSPATIPPRKTKPTTAKPTRRPQLIDNDKPKDERNPKTTTTLKPKGPQVGPSEPDPPPNLKPGKPRPPLNKPGGVEGQLPTRKTPAVSGNKPRG